MAIKIDRVGELLEGVKHKRRVIITPEGVALDVRIAGHGERLGAFAIDIVFMGLAVFLLYLLLWFLFFSGSNLAVGMTIILFAAFVVRNLYFVHFELAWQGRTPGKKICGLRVINRQGGELSPSAVIARNLTREVELFIPLKLFMTLGFQDDVVQGLAFLGWLLVIASLPLWNRGGLRAGDLIAGTQVIAMPKRRLLKDLTLDKIDEAAHYYAFTPEQLAVYGALELQVLEEFLRRPPTVHTQKLLTEVARKICHKIGWDKPLPETEMRRFLTDFYAAERAELERGQLFGRHKADKNSGPEVGK